MNIIIRHAEADDYQALTEVFKQPGVIYGTLRLPFPSSELWRERLNNKQPGSYSLVACVEERVVASLGLVSQQNQRLHHIGDIGMAVHDEWQGKGVGSALLAAATDMADNWLGLLRLELTVYTDNEAAITLYQKYGFEIEGTLRRAAFRAGEYVDCYCMARLHQRLVLDKAG